MAGRAKDDGKGRRTVTSTPNPRAKDDDLPPQLDLNASRILGYSVYKRPQKDSANASKIEAASSSSSFAATARAAKTKSPDEPIIMQAKYLQAAFINATAIKAQKRHREQMKTGLDSLVAYNESLMKKIADLQAKVDVAEKETLFAETLKSHMDSGLFNDASADRYNSVAERCEALNTALAATMNTLETENVVIPQDDSEKQALLEKLDNIERTLTADPIVTEFMERVIEECEVGKQVAKALGDQMDDLEEITNTAEEMSEIIEKGNSLHICNHQK